VSDCPITKYKKAYAAVGIPMVLFWHPPELPFHRGSESRARRESVVVRGDSGEVSPDGSAIAVPTKHKA